MKKILFTVLLFMASLYAEMSVNQIEEMVSKIHLEREGIKLEKLETTKEPFVRVEEENNKTTFVTPVEDLKLILHAIMNGKAYINESWYDVNDTVMGYSLKHVGKNGVVLRNGNNIKKLFLRKKRDDFIILEER